MFYGHHYPEIIGNLIVPLSMIIIVLCMDWRVGLVMLLPIVIYMMCLGIMGKLAMKNFPIMEAATQKLNSSLVEYVHGMKEIRIFAAEGKSWSRFEESAESYCGFMTPMVRGMPPFDDGQLRDHGFRGRLRLSGGGLLVRRREH